MQPRLNTRGASKGKALGGGYFSDTYELDDGFVVYEPKDWRNGVLDTSKYVMLLAAQRAPSNPHLPAFVSLDGGKTIACVRYERVVDGVPRIRTTVTRRSVQMIANILILAPREIEALHAIVDVLQTMPPAKARMAVWDIHHGNIMYNSEGDMVFVDPIFFRNETAAVY